MTRKDFYIGVIWSAVTTIFCAAAPAYMTYVLYKSVSEQNVLDTVLSIIVLLLVLASMYMINVWTWFNLGNR